MTRRLYYFLGALSVAFWFAGCGSDDLKNVSTVSSKTVTLSKDRSYDVQIIYSDSAHVKAKGFAPIMDKVTPSVGSIYNEMPKGVNIDFYDQLLRKSGSIKSDYAINKQSEKLTIFKKNVVVVSDNMTFTTEELTWDENKRLYTSPYGTVRSADGSVITGTQFSAPQDFSTYSITQASGQTPIDNMHLGQ